MILSFHPIFIGDANILMADRIPGQPERSAIKAADAVILPQGCSQALYEMALENCRMVFPNYDIRFEFPGKIGQARLFDQTATPHPQTAIFETVDDFFLAKPGPTFPCVFKFNWGGEGETVFKVSSQRSLNTLLQKAKGYEASGQCGFLIQQYIATQKRSLRIVVIGESLISYWRVQPNPQRLHSNLAKGAYIDTESDPAQRQLGVAAVEHFCRKTGLNLAGIDLLISGNPPRLDLHFLEINYFFGRRGLGGTERFYRLLISEIRKWLQRHGLAVKSAVDYH